MQNSDGSMPAGHNGPYKDIETPVRNTAHWNMIFLKAFDFTRLEKYQKAAESSTVYLNLPECRPMDATFWVRKKPEKDFSNGLVGQAWVIESLLAYHKYFPDKNLVELVEKVFLLHPFIKKFGAWKIVNVDGSERGFDPTFNHQLWFAASGALIWQCTGNKEIGDQVKGFMDLLDEHLSLYKDGVIRHLSYKYLAEGKIRLFEKWLSEKRASNKRKDYLRSKSYGYHGFNLYGLALLHSVFPDHPFWQSTSMSKALEVTRTEKFKKEVSKSKYGYPYNPPGFELAYAWEEFGFGDEGMIQNVLKDQILRGFNFETGLFDNGETYDKLTAAARLYEATRLGDVEVLIEK